MRSVASALQATSIDNLLYVSGQIPLVPGTSNFAAEDIEGQTDQVLKNLGAILEKAGSSFDQVLKTTVLLSDMADFQKMNGIYGASTCWTGMPAGILLQRYMLCCKTVQCKNVCRPSCHGILKGMHPTCSTHTMLAICLRVRVATGKYFTSSPPARACFAVKALPLNAKVEIEAVAIRSKL